jgi:hypothetical protein
VTLELFVNEDDDHKIVDLNYKTTSEHWKKTKVDEKFIVQREIVLTPIRKPTM